VKINKKRKEKRNNRGISGCHRQEKTSRQNERTGVFVKLAGGGQRGKKKYKEPRGKKKNEKREKLKLFLLGPGAGGGFKTSTKRRCITSGILPKNAHAANIKQGRREGVVAKRKRNATVHLRN